MSLNSLYLINKIRFGETKNLIKKIGDNNFEYLKKKGFILQGTSHPEIWRITKKGIIRYRAITSPIARFIARIIWKLNI